MGSKASGKTYVSKGIHSNVSSKYTKEAKRNRPEDEKIINVQRAWREGRNPCITIDNPNGEQTNKRKIRVRANDLWGSPKEMLKKMFIMK